MNPLTLTPDDLKALRAARGLSQRALADLIGVSRNTINRWEMGLHPIPKWAYLLMARYQNQL